MVRLPCEPGRLPTPRKPVFVASPPLRLMVPTLTVRLLVFAWPTYSDSAVSVPVNVQGVLPPSNRAIRATPAPDSVPAVATRKSASSALVGGPGAPEVWSIHWAESPSDPEPPFQVNLLFMSRPPASAPRPTRCGIY